MANHKYKRFEVTSKLGREFTFEGIKGTAHISVKEWEAVRRYCKDGHYLEIGSFSGYSTTAAYMSAKSITCIDRKVQKIPMKIADVFIEGDSMEAYKKLKREDLYDFILIDGNHTEEYCAADLKNYYPFLRPGGFIGIHDYGEAGTYLGVWGVAEAVDKFFDESQYVETIESLIIFKKPEGKDNENISN